MTEKTTATGKPEASKQTHPNIYAALSAFQGELKPIEKDGVVDFTTKSGDKVNFKYSTLGKIMEVLYPLLGKHGLSVRHELSEKGIDCVLAHETAYQKTLTVKVQDIESGSEKERDFALTNELRSGKLPVKTDGDEKSIGARLTYFKRYTLGLVLGLATEEDKDAEILEKTHAATEKFAFTQAKKTIEKAEGTDLDKQIVFLERELKVAKDFEAGVVDKVPSLGLKASQIEGLLTIAVARKSGKPEVVVNPGAPITNDGRDDEGFAASQK